jgi:putative spermidine/putrescine transport system permease protein
MSAYDPKRYSVAIVAWILLIFLAAPVLVNLPVSLTDRTYLSFPSHGLSLQHYERLIADRVWMQTALNSLFVAAVTSAIATILGGLCAYACWQVTSRLAARFIIAVVLSPLVIPSIVSALGFRRVLVQMSLFDTYLGVILVHIVTAIPYVFICVSAALRLFDIKYIHAARSLGASQFQAIRRILIPSVFSGLLSGFVLAFIHSWDEVIILLFISGRNVMLLPKRMMQGIQDDIDPTIAAVASVLVVLTTIGVILSMLYNRRADRSKSAPQYLST